jgi:hypothetical protein
MKNLTTKTYKFIYFSDVSRYDPLDKKQRRDYTFGNRMPSTHTNKWTVHGFFRNFDDFTTRKHFSNKPIRRIKREDFLPRNVPANEANITLAFVKKFTYELNDYRRKLTFLNKEMKDTVKYPNGMNPMTYNVFNPEYYRVAIKHSKENLKIWKERYQELKDRGVYTYIELIK